MCRKHQIRMHQHFLCDRFQDCRSLLGSWSNRHNEWSLHAIHHIGSLSRRKHRKECCCNCVQRQCQTGGIVVTGADDIAGLKPCFLHAPKSSEFGFGKRVFIQQTQRKIFQVRNVELCFLSGRRQETDGLQGRADHLAVSHEQNQRFLRYSYAETGHRSFRRAARTPIR